MSNVATIPTAEMVDDYYASLLDKTTCERLLGVAEIALEAEERDGAAIARAKGAVAYLRERIEGNGYIMDVIEKELERRGELGLVRKVAE